MTLSEAPAIEGMAASSMAPHAPAARNVAKPPTPCFEKEMFVLALFHSVLSIAHTPITNCRKRIMRLRSRAQAKLLASHSLHFDSLGQIGGF
jgi:hypothetical protein